MQTNRDFTKGYLKRCIEILVVFVMIVCNLFSDINMVFANTGKAKNTKTTIKVAFYQLDGFFEYDEKGNECGYGVDYLNELKKYENVEWEYVPVDSWEDISEMMKNGQVDVKMPVSEPSKPSETSDYSIEPILTTYHAIMTKKNRTDLFFKDYDTISNLKIAITKELSEKTGFNYYLNSIGVNDNIIFYNDYNSCKAELDAGNVDALISNVMDLTDDMKILDKFAVVNNYIITLKGDPCYNIINEAMTQLKLDNPSFQSMLYEKYYPERAVSPYTKEENEYIKNNPKLTVAVFADRRPVSYYDKETDSYKGIAIDIANNIAKKIGITFNYIPIENAQPIDMLEKADIVMPVSGNPDMDKYFVTSSILDSEVSMAVKIGKEKIEEGSKIGVLSSTQGIKKIIEKEGIFKIVEYKSNREALNALQKGKIDAFANASYVTNYLIENPRYSDLTVLNYQTFSIEYSLCGNIDDVVLQSILNKAIQTLSNSEKEKIIQDDSRFSMHDLSFKDKIYIYKDQILSGIILAVIVVVVALLYNHSRTNYIREIEESSRKQEKANQAKSEFLSRMSHDMRTPLNVIMGMANLAKDNDNPEDTNESLAKINTASEFLLGLINDVLDMEHMESGKMELNLLPYSGQEFSHYIESVILPLCEQKNIKFEYTYDGTNDFVVIQDKLRINQIYFNLLSNAVKFTPEGGVVGFHTHFEKKDNDKMKMKVIISDSGIGMSKEFQKQMFEPFSQENQVFKPIGESTGLGLSIVKKICDLMNMTINVESEIGKGTIFTLEGEYEIADESSNYIEESSEISKIKSIESLKNKTFLVCEDHPLNQEIIRRMLEKKGAIVVLADDGKRGLEIFKQSLPGNFKAILMDIRMPVMDGFRATQEIRKLNRPDAKTIPIIALTANAYDDDIQKCVDAGMNEHLSKPIEPEKLYGTLIKYM